MTQLLFGAPVAEYLFQKTQSLLQEQNIHGYLAIFALKENDHDHPSMVYVRKKIEYANKLLLDTRIYKNYIDKDSLLADIDICNNDVECLGVIIQLPLPRDLQEHQADILNAVDPKKDVDCLGDSALLLAATPSAILSILSYYDYDDFTDKHIAVLGESRLIGKPLAKRLSELGANIYTFNEFSDQHQMREICRKSDYIMACTGSLHLVDESFVSENNPKQIIVDAGWGMIDNKPAGDVYTEKIMGKIQTLTPVPGGVGPVTVASLFWNLAQLVTNKQ